MVKNDKPYGNGDDGSDDDPDECPHCREIKNYYPFPMTVLIICAVIIIFVVCLLFIQYTFVSKENKVCQGLLGDHHV